MDESRSSVAQPIAPAPSAGTVLVVDDEPSILRMLDLSLQHDGFTVWQAGDGEEAVRLYERHRGTIDLVLLDVRMSQMDGPRTLEVLRGIDPNVRCCFMSGNAGEYSVDELMGLGAVAFIPKPFASLAEVARTLRRLMAGAVQPV